MNDYEKKVDAWLADRGIEFMAMHVGQSKPWGGQTVKETFMAAFHRPDQCKVLMTPFYSGSMRVSAHDVLSCLQKYEYQGLDEFAEEFHYPKRPFSETLRTYEACVDEYRQVVEFFSANEISELLEIAQ